MRATWAAAGGAAKGADKKVAQPVKKEETKPAADEDDFDPFADDGDDEVSYLIGSYILYNRRLRSFLRPKRRRLRSQRRRRSSPLLSQSFSSTLSPTRLRPISMLSSRRFTLSRRTASSGNPSTRRSPSLMESTSSSLVASSRMPRSPLMTSRRPSRVSKRKFSPAILPLSTRFEQTSP